MKKYFLQEQVFHNPNVLEENLANFILFLLKQLISLRWLERISFFFFERFIQRL